MENVFALLGPTLCVQCRFSTNMEGPEGVVQGRIKVEAGFGESRTRLPALLGTLQPEVGSGLQSPQRESWLLFRAELVAV